jgi:hypothetical protein
MPSPQTCGSKFKTVRGDDSCGRPPGHRGKHQGRYARWPQTKEDRAASVPRRYVPPHRRPEGGSATTPGRRGRYQRPYGAVSLVEATGDTAQMED